MALKQRLRHNLAQDGDEEGGNKTTDKPSEHLAEEDGVKAVHEHVAQQQRAQQQVAVFAYGYDLLRVFSVLLHAVSRIGARPRLNHNFKTDQIQTQQPQRQAGEQSGQNEQHGDDDIVECGVARGGGAIDLKLAACSERGMTMDEGG